MKKIAISLAIAVLVFSSCDDFYSSSMGSSRAYDWEKIDITISNVSDWFQATVGNPPLAEAVMKAINHRLNTVTNPYERAIFLEYASKLAMEASGLGTSILLTATDLLGVFSSDADPEDLVDNVISIFDKLQWDFITRGGAAAAANLAGLVSNGLVPGTNQPGNTPKFDPNYINRVQSSDVAEAVIVLVLGEMSNNGHFDIDNLDELENLGLDLTNDIPPLVKVMDNAYPSEEAIAIAAYLNLIAEHPEKFDDNPITNAIYDTLINQSGNANEAETQGEDE